MTSIIGYFVSYVAGFEERMDDVIGSSLHNLALSLFTCYWRFLPRDQPFPSALHPKPFTWAQSQHTSCTCLFQPPYLHAIYYLFILFIKVNPPVIITMCGLCGNHYSDGSLAQAGWNLGLLIRSAERY